jgi:tetratricopeptide (TPR) repeat protein
VEARRLSAVFGMFKRRGGMPRKMLTECRRKASGMLREMATIWHREAQKTQNDATYALAGDAYRAYLDSFPRESDRYMMNFYYAELQFKLGHWEEAFESYTKVVKMKRRGKYLKEAAYGAVISLQNALNLDEDPGNIGRKAKEKGLKKRPIPPRQLKLLAALDTYVKHVTSSEELVPIKYRRARIYYDNNHFRKAARLFAAIAKKHSSHPLAVYSANLLLDSLNASNRYIELEEWIDRFLSNPELAKGEFLRQLKKLKGDIGWKQAEQYRKVGQFRKCGERYARIANGNPYDKRWAKWVYSGAICFEAAKLIGLAISLRNKLVEVKPDDPLAQRALYMIGQNYHALAWYKNAAKYYEKFAKKFPGEKEAPNALQNAFIFRLGRGEYDRAIEDAKLFEQNYGRKRKYAALAAGVNFSLGTIYEQRRDYDAISRHYKNYIDRWGSRGGLDRVVVAYVKVGDALWRGSCPVEGINGACIKIKRVRSKRSIRRARRGRRHRKRIEVRAQCGPETKNRITIEIRHKRKARTAIKYIGKALALARRARRTRLGRVSKQEKMRRKQELNFAIAQARFHLAEDLFEKFLQVKFPRNLDFSGRSSRKLALSKRRFKKYLAKKGKLLTRARKVYQDVIKSKNAHWAIAASARIGQLFQNFSDALYTAPVPKPPFPRQLRTRQQKMQFAQIFTDSYCDNLEDVAGKLEKKAVGALETCLGKSTDLSWYNEWSSLCEQELNQIKPAEFPLATELRAKPLFVKINPSQASLVEDPDWGDGR